MANEMSQLIGIEFRNRHTSVKWRVLNSTDNKFLYLVDLLNNKVRCVL